MKKIIFILAAVLSAAAIFTACSKRTEQNDPRDFSCNSISPTFSADIQPILTTVCSINSNCHAGGSANSGGPFTTHAQVFAKMTAIRASILAGTMPQSGSLTQAQVNAFICWIDSGGINN
jgi:hypothetical protein